MVSENIVYQQESPAVEAYKLGVMAKAKELIEKPIGLPAPTLTDQNLLQKQAEQYAETTEQGKRLAYLKALQTKAKDMVAEASVSDDLKSSLDNLFAFVGVTWEQKLPALPNLKK